MYKSLLDTCIHDVAIQRVWKADGTAAGARLATSAGASALNQFPARIGLAWHGWHGVAWHGK
eukprot:7628382-Lingulodinium_polyedra.AAC.1